MKVIQQSTDVLIVKTELILAAILGIGFVVMSIFAVYSYVLYADTAQGLDFFGFGASATALLLFSVVIFNKTEFVFDRRLRIVTWKKRTIFTNRSGQLDFDEIKSIIVQSQLDNDKEKSGSIAIITKTGELPLTRAYTGANLPQIIRITEKLNQWVFNDHPELTLGAILFGCSASFQGIS